MSKLSELEKLELNVRIKKAEAARLEIDYKILKLREEIERAEDHKALQDENINTYKEKLAEG